MPSQPVSERSLTGLEMLVLESTLYLGREWDQHGAGLVGEPGKGVGFRVQVKIVGGRRGSLAPEFNLDFLWAGVGVIVSQTRGEAKFGVCWGQDHVRGRAWEGAEGWI